MYVASNTLCDLVVSAYEWPYLYSANYKLVSITDCANMSWLCLYVQLNEALRKSYRSQMETIGVCVQVNETLKRSYRSQMETIVSVCRWIRGWNPRRWKTPYPTPDGGTPVPTSQRTGVGRTLPSGSCFGAQRMGSAPRGSPPRGPVVWGGMLRSPLTSKVQFCHFIWSLRICLHCKITTRPCPLLTYRMNDSFRLDIMWT